MPRVKGRNQVKAARKHTRLKYPEKEPFEAQDVSYVLESVVVYKGLT